MGIQASSLSHLELKVHSRHFSHIKPQCSNCPNRGDTGIVCYSFILLQAAFNLFYQATPVWGKHKLWKVKCDTTGIASSLWSTNITPLEGALHTFWHLEQRELDLIVGWLQFIKGVNRGQPPEEKQTRTPGTILLFLTPFIWKRNRPLKNLRAQVVQNLHLKSNWTKNVGNGGQSHLYLPHPTDIYTFFS